MVEEPGETASNARAEVTPPSGVNVRSLVILTNAVGATVGGLFITTGSIAVTALATVLTALLGVCVAVSHRM